MIRLYRGEGPTRPLTNPRSTVGRYFTTSLSYARAHASAQDGRVYFVDVTEEELPPAIGNEYLVSRNVAERKRVLEEER